jgi:soluble lytic murein transglycosylase
VEQLLAAGLYDDAVAELRKSAGSPGASPFIDATIAYALNRKGELRPAITAMRRAYPEFMAEGGETLPTAILKVIFPLDYWALIRQQATARELDPYLVAALVAQESTFRADVRSAANAWGLMQILPSTGQRVARQIGLRPFSTRVLTNPETNVRLGTTYFADLLEDLGDPAFALAAYNAGPHRVTRWQAERRGLALDEFIDDIPFPETQNYVKRILGTADDYRILYGSSARP